VIFEISSNEVSGDADVIALEVHPLAVFAEAIFSAAFCQELLLGRSFQEHVDIAFNLLSGRPIDLAILLKAFLVLLNPLLLPQANSPALVVLDLTIAIMAIVILAVSRLAFCLKAITLGIVLDVLAVRFLALAKVQLPLRVAFLEDLEVAREPLAHFVVDPQLGDFAIAIALAIPSGVRKQAAVMRTLHGAILLDEGTDKKIQTTARSNVRSVLTQEVLTTFFVFPSLASFTTVFTAHNLLILAPLKARHLSVQLLLVIAVSFAQSATDIAKQNILDHAKSCFHIWVQVICCRLISNGLLHKILEEGGHLSDIAAANCIKEVVHSSLQCGLDFQ